jgi:membrane-bound serine protease (ClpP class)
MHGVLAFIAGVCATIGVLLLVFALAGVTYYGITPQAQLAIALTALIIAVIAMVILYFALESRKYKIETGKEALIGSSGKAVTDLNPNGTVRVNGEFWQATTKDRAVKTGDSIKVVNMEGMFLVVEPVEDKA